MRASKKLYSPTCEEDFKRLNRWVKIDGLQNTKIYYGYAGSSSYLQGHDFGNGFERMVSLYLVSKVDRCKA